MIDWVNKCLSFMVDIYPLWWKLISEVSLHLQTKLEDGSRLTFSYICFSSFPFPGAPYRFSFRFFPGFLAVFILSSNRNKYYVVIINNFIDVGAVHYRSYFDCWHVGQNRSLNLNTSGKPSTQDQFEIRGYRFDSLPAYFFLCPGSKL